MEVKTHRSTPQQKSGVYHGAPPLLPGAIDVSCGKCRWKAFYRDQLIRDRFDPKLLEPPIGIDERTFFRQLFERVKNEGNFWIIVVGEVGIGKSDTGITYSWKFDRNFMFDKIVADNKSMAECLKKYKKNFTLMYDEPQREMRHHRWQQLDSSLAEFFETQREFGINGVFCPPNLEIIKTLRTLAHYVVNLVYRCKFHTHGYLFKRTPQAFTEEWVRVGIVKMWNPLGWAPPDLLEMLANYHEIKKKANMEAIQNALYNEFAGRGRVGDFAQAFIDYLNKNELPLKRDFLRAFANRYYRETFSKADVEKRLWPEVSLLVSSGEMELIAK